MIASEQEEVLRVLDFVAKKEADCFNGLLSTVNVVTQEQVVSLRREATVLKDPQQVVVLSMHITYKVEQNVRLHHSLEVREPRGLST